MNSSGRAGGLLASSGRPLSEIARSWGFQLRSFGLGATEIAAGRRDGFGRRESPLRRENERLRMEREVLRKLCASSRNHRNEVSMITDMSGEGPESRNGAQTHMWYVYGPRPIEIRRAIFGLTQSR